MRSLWIVVTLALLHCSHEAEGQKTTDELISSIFDIPITTQPPPGTLVYSSDF